METPHDIKMIHGVGGQVNQTTQSLSWLYLDYGSNSEFLNLSFQILSTTTSTLQSEIRICLEWTETHNYTILVPSQSYRLHQGS